MIEEKKQNVGPVLAEQSKPQIVDSVDLAKKSKDYLNNYVAA